jgi:uncharacterized OB-fold protein
MTIRLQTCAVCGARQYPERDLCRVCLADVLQYEEDDGRGRLLAEATLHRSLDPAFASELPLRIGAVALDAGVRVIALIEADARAGDAVVLRTTTRLNHTLFVAEKEQQA